tara:strand:- start:166 stop:423 length:258 start_codon:yes stop_codon:yes gene_type:complete
LFDIELENLTRELSVRYDRVIDAMNETTDLTDEVLEAIELHEKQARLVVSHLGKEKSFEKLNAQMVDMKCDERECIEKTMEFLQR